MESLPLWLRDKDTDVKDEYFAGPITALIIIEYLNEPLIIAGLVG